MRRELILLGAALASAAALAQPAADDPDWKEAQVPPPPALRTEGLVPVEIGSSALRFGVDPASVSVGKDRIVRYVIVATSSSGAVNAMYEGIRCDRDEYRVYARHSPGQGWRMVDTEWKSVKEGVEAVHVRAVARAGACLGHSPSGTADVVVRNLRSPNDRKFGASGAP
jgi:hypothetical protein